MEYRYTWHIRTGVEDSRLKEIEKKIKTDLESKEPEFLTACHLDYIIINLSTAGPLFNQFVGNVKCSCEEPLIEIRGNIEPNMSITYKQIKKNA